MTEPQYLYVHNWRDWQSYRSDRSQPPWIKVHRQLLRSERWMDMPDEQKAHLLAVWLLAADKDGRVPNDSKKVQRLCQLHSEPDLNSLIELGFLDAKVTPKRRQRDANVTPQTRLDTTRPDQTRKREVATISLPAGGSRLQDNWTLPAEFREFAFKEGMRHDDIEKEAENFKDYWVSVVGQRGIKRSWIATWRIWIRRRDQFNGERPQRRNGYSHADKTSNMLDGLRIAALSEAPHGGDGSTDQPAGVGEGAGSTGEARQITDGLDS